MQPSSDRLDLEPGEKSGRKKTEAGECGIPVIFTVPLPDREDINRVLSVPDLKSPADPLLSRVDLNRYLDGSGGAVEILKEKLLSGAGKGSGAEELQRSVKYDLGVTHGILQ